MAGYTTQKRSFPLEENSVFRTAPGYTNILAKRTAVRVHDQVTYSYRTSKLKKDTQLAGFVDRIDKDTFLGVTYNGFTQNPTNSWDTGHEFKTTRTRELCSPGRIVKFKAINSTQSAFYSGPITLVPNSVLLWDTFPTIADMTSNDRIFYGSQAIAQVAPTRPSSSLAVTVGELLSEGLPNMGATLIELTQRAKYFQGIGSATLALKFGLEPFIRDLLKIANSVIHTNEILSQYIKDSGKQVRRRYDFKPTTSTVIDNTGKGRLVGPTNEFSYNLAGDVSIETTTTQKIWFTGAFLYHAPQLNVERGVDYNKLAIVLADRCNQVLGNKLSPEVIWEILPFSWLVDWISSVGASISNYTRFSDSDLVMRYGYIMRETVIVKRVVLPGANRFESTSYQGPVTRSFICIKKERYQATPFGFGLNPNSFTASQWAILAALGLSKGGQKLP